MVALYPSVYGTSTRFAIINLQITL